jgi:hypothetical protein
VRPWKRIVRFFKFSLYDPTIPHIDPIPRKSSSHHQQQQQQQQRRRRRKIKANEVADPLRFASSAAALPAPGPAHQQENNKQGTIVVSVIHSFQQQTNRS